MDNFPFKIAGTVLCLFVFVFYVVTKKIGNDPTYGTQVLLSIVLFVLGYWSYRFRQIEPNKLLGILEIIAGVASNWFQIPKYANETVNRPERVIFVVAAVALIAHGFKKVKEGAKCNDGRDDVRSA